MSGVDELSLKFIVHLKRGDKDGLQADESLPSVKLLNWNDMQVDHASPNSDHGQVTGHLMNWLQELKNSTQAVYPVPP